MVVRDPAATDTRAPTLHGPIQRILVIYVTRIGDTMMLTPTLRSLHQAFPQAEIDCIGSSRSYAVLENLPFVSSVRAAKKRWIHFQGWLSPRRYDLAFVFGFDKDEAFVKYALRQARQVVAFTQADAALNRRLLAAIDKPAFGTCHGVDHLMTLPRAVGVDLDGRCLAYRVTDAEAAWAQAHLRQLGIAGQRPRIGLQIASFPTRAYRDWPVENFLALCRQVLAVHPEAHFIILGGPLEHERTAWLADQLGRHATLQAGKLDLRQSAALMDTLDLYIGVDTGPTHIMGALHRPMVAMYHAASPSFMLAPLDHPCLEIIDHPRAGEVGQEASMNEVPVSRVADAALSLLARHFRAG